MIATPTRHTPRDETIAVIRAARARGRRQLLFLMLGALTLLIVGFSFEILVGGSADIPLSDIPAGLLGRSGGLADYVIFETRLPRALTAVLAGCLFGLSGVLYQRLISNVLGTPDILGVSAGASAGAAVVLITAGATGIAIQGGALIGAILAAALIFTFAWNGGASTYRLVLVGIGMGACFSAITSFVLVYADEATSTRAMRWMIGSLGEAEWGDVRVLLFALLVGAVAIKAIYPSVEMLRLGDPLAASLGTNVQFIRIATLLLGAVLAAVATSVTGPISFVALVAGPIAVRLAPEGGPLPAGLVGAVVLLLSDAVAQEAPYISPVPTGIVTGIVGAPVLLFLLINRKGHAG